MTTNAVPSLLPEDFLLNVENLDAFSNSEAPTFSNRLGVQKTTISGAVSRIETDVAQVEALKEQAVNVDIPDAIYSLRAFNSRGAFSGATAYALKDVYVNDGIAYVTVIAHTSTSVAADLAAGNVVVHQGATREDLAAAGGADDIGFQPQGSGAAPTTVQAKLRGITSRAGSAARPAYIDQFINGFFGRGMLTAEAINLVTEQFLTAVSAVGAGTISVTDSTNFLVGACVTIKHDNGIYATYFVSSKAANVLSILPALRYAVSETSKIERTWFNRAHPGKFYMRSLAQRVARSTEQQAAMPSGPRILYSGFVDNASKFEDQIIGVVGGVVGYYSPSNLGPTSDTSSPIRFGLTQTALVSVSAVGDGAETRLFKVSQGLDCIVNIVFSAALVSPSFSIQVRDESDNIVHEFMVPNGAAQRVLQSYCIRFNSGMSRYMKLVVVCTAGPFSEFHIGQIDVFEAPGTNGEVINSLGPVIVGLGDSWVAGDLGSTLEREPIMQQLALELPDATIINAGIGGNKIWEQVARFETDVAVHNPDYVVVNTGTNESYNPASGTFEPNSTDYFVSQYKILIGKIYAIGARPIIIGVPALAQSDEDVPAFAEWLLNDRARAYARAFSEAMGDGPLAYGAKSGLDAYQTDATLTTGATPSVAMLRKVVLDYPAPTTISNLSGGVSGQIVTLLAINGNITLQHGTLLLHGAENVTLPTNGNITLMRLDIGYSSGWVELSRALPVLPPSTEVTLTAASGLTPSVAGYHYVNLDYSAPVVITDFLGAAKNQEIQIRSVNGNVTLSTGNFYLSGSVNAALTANSIITLRRGDPFATSAWYEVSRSIK